MKTQEQILKQREYSLKHYYKHADKYLGKKKEEYQLKKDEIKQKYVFRKTWFGQICRLANL